MLCALCGFQAPPGGGLAIFPVVHSERETPLPIPNRAVKPFSADGTWGATPWESRSPPVLHLGRPPGRPLLVAGLEAVLAQGCEIDQEVDGVGQPSRQWSFRRIEHRFDSRGVSGWKPEAAALLAIRAWRRRLSRVSSASGPPGTRDWTAGRRRGWASPAASLPSAARASPSSSCAGRRTRLGRVLC
jgi:hypothetical protein